MKIAIITVPGFLWSPEDIKTGLNGSEEAIVYISNEFVKKGISVDVYTNPNRIIEGTSETPGYYPMTHLSKNIKYDKVIVWRQNDGVKYINHGPIYFWPHDIYTGYVETKGLSGIFFLSEAQREMFYSHQPNLATIPYIISGNGLTFPPNFSPLETKRDRYKCVYASNYSRGLIALLSMWPSIKREVPEATLDIYYGRETWGTVHPRTMALIVKKIEENKDNGVTEIGKVGHSRLFEEMSKASLLTYPCIAFETYCITLVRAQACGMYPVIPKMSALPENTHEDVKTLSPINSYESAVNYRNEVVRLLKSGVSEETRRKISEYASKKTWSKVSEMWVDFWKKH